MQITLGGKKIKVELKNVKFFQGREGQGLNADVFIDGKSAFHVNDSANGGEFHYSANGYDANAPSGGITFKLNQGLLQALSEYASSLEDRLLYPEEPQRGTFPMDLDTLINDMVEASEKERFANKMKKDMLTKVVIGVEGQSSYGTVNIKVAIASLTQEQKDKLIQDVQKFIKPGQKILNTNLPVSF